MMNKAGRELDALVAEKVMGDVAWDYVIEGSSRCGRQFSSIAEAEEHRLQSRYHVGPVVLHDSIPCYSTEIAAALEVAEHFREYSVHKFDSGQPPEDTAPNLAKGYHVVIVASEEDLSGGVEAEADTAPLAICLAALKAVA